MKFISLLLLFAFPAWAQEQAGAPLAILEVQTAVILTPDDRTIQVIGGVWLDAETTIGVAQEVAALRAENKALREADTLSPRLVVMALVAGLSLGLGTAFILRR